MMDNILKLPEEILKILFDFYIFDHLAFIFFLLMVKVNCDIIGLIFSIAQFWHTFWK